MEKEAPPRTPPDDTVVRAGDEVVAVPRRESQDALRAVLTGQPSTTTQEGA